MRLKTRTFALTVAMISIAIILTAGVPAKKKVETVTLQTKPFLVSTSPKQHEYVKPVLSLIGQKNIKLPPKQVKEVEEISDVPKVVAQVAPVVPAPKQVSRGGKSLATFEITAYDLSIQSCGKPVGHKDYGKTASGSNLSGLTWKNARAISVDPKVIPLGSKVHLEFTSSGYERYSGTYTAVDTGGAIGGNRIDFFMGDFRNNKPSKQALEFGRTNAKVTILE